MSLQVLAYNMTRVIAILGAGPLIATIRGKARLLCGTRCQVSFQTSDAFSHSLQPEWTFLTTYELRHHPALKTAP